ncbi:MAG: hypothetical protein EAZ07_00375 [Cytophagales bacterium]|nr:MAG: hypothetical protein EAZ07_00375 [Cytophagales bacterium]
MLKKGTCFFLLFCLLSYYFNSLQMIIHYHLNTEYYTTVLCENKVKPQMNCNGKCALAKKLKKQDQSNSTKNSHNNTIKFNINFIVPVVPELNKNKLSIVIKIFNSNWLNRHYTSPTRNIFQPPQLIKA